MENCIIISEFDSILEERLLNNPKYINHLPKKELKNIFVEYSLAANGLNDSNISDYYKKFSEIFYDFLAAKSSYLYASCDVPAQKYIFDNYKFAKHAQKLSDLIDNKKGNCIALADLFTCFSLKMGDDVEIFSSNQDKHFFSRIIKNGFEYFSDCAMPLPITQSVMNSNNHHERAYSFSPARIYFGKNKKCDFSDFIGAIYRSRAYGEKNPEKSLELYKKAIIMNPSDCLSIKSFNNILKNF